LDQLLPALADVLGIGVVRLGFFETGGGPLQIGFGLFDGRLGPGDTRALLAVVEAG
jgi:hypothetical protein